MTSVSYKSLSDKLTFVVAGQSLCDLVIAGDPQRSYPEGSKLETTSAWGGLCADLGNAVGTACENGALRPCGLVYSWQPVATIRHRPPTTLDAELEATQLVVLDIQFWTANELRCPHHHLNQVGTQPCGGQLKPEGWVDNASSSCSSKGEGEEEAHTTTIYLCSRTRKCDTCGRFTQDDMILDQLPQPLRRLMPAAWAAKGLQQMPQQPLRRLMPSACDQPQQLPQLLMPPAASAAETHHQQSDQATEQRFSPPRLYPDPDEDCDEEEHAEEERWAFKRESCSSLMVLGAVTATGRQEVEGVVKLRATAAAERGEASRTHWLGAPAAAGRQEAAAAALTATHLRTAASTAAAKREEIEAAAAAAAAAQVAAAALAEHFSAAAAAQVAAAALSTSQIEEDAATALVQLQQTTTTPRSSLLTAQG